MKKSKIVFLAILIIVLMCLGIYFIPMPQRVQLVMHGVEVDVEGNVVDSGRMSIDGWIYQYLIQPDSFVLSDLELPNRQVGSVFEYSYPITDAYGDSEYFITNGRITLPEYTSQQVYTANIIYNKDQICWVIEVTDRIFVGTVENDSDYVQIMDDFAWIIDGFLES